MHLKTDGFGFDAPLQIAKFVCSINLIYGLKIQELVSTYIYSIECGKGKGNQ